MEFFEMWNEKDFYFTICFFSHNMLLIADVLSTKYKIIE